MAPLDLDRTRDWQDLAYDAVTVWWRHAPLFIVLAALVVAPVEALPLPSYGDEIAAMLIVPAIVTAMHVVAVMDLGAGRRPSIARSSLAALRRAPVVIATVGLYLLAVTLGLLALLVPGLYLLVALYFGPQAAVAEGCSPVAALRRSYVLVKYDWARVFLIGFFVTMIPSLVTLPIDALLGAVLGDDGIEDVVRGTVAWSLAISLSALATTLLFFDLKARAAID